MTSVTEAVTDDLQALIVIARASVTVLGKGHATTGDLRSDVVAMRSILSRIDRRLDDAEGRLEGRAAAQATEDSHD